MTIFPRSVSSRMLASITLCLAVVLLPIARAGAVSPAAGFDPTNPTSGVWVVEDDSANAGCTYPDGKACLPGQVQVFLVHRVPATSPQAAHLPHLIATESRAAIASFVSQQERRMLKQPTWLSAAAARQRVALTSKLAPWSRQRIRPESRSDSRTRRMMSTCDSLGGFTSTLAGTNYNLNTLGTNVYSEIDYQYDSQGRRCATRDYNRYNSGNYTWRMDNAEACDTSQQCSPTQGCGNPYPGGDCYDNDGRLSDCIGVATGYGASMGGNVWNISSSGRLLKTKFSSGSSCTWFDTYEDSIVWFN